VISGRRAKPRAEFDGVAIVSPFAWDGPWQTPHYVARQLATRVPVVFAEKPATWSPGDPDFALAKWRRRAPTAVPPAAVSVVWPRGAPFSRFRPLRELTLRGFGAKLGAELDRREISRPLGWVSYFAGCLAHLERTRVRTFVYHCLDAFDAPEELELARRAAAVLAVSPELVAKHARSNPNTFHAPNGVDARAFAGPPAPPSPVRARPAGRRIGFVGILSRHIDFVLLEKIAGAFADDQLVIGGPVLRGASAPIGEQKAALARLRRMTNVQLLGFVEPALVPALIQSFAVGIIPFVPNDFNAGRDPIKFYHYLAHGKPVVTSPVAVAREHARLCQIAETHPGFVAGIERALSEDDDAVARERIALARCHTWEALVPQAVHAIETAGIVLRRAT